MTRAASASGRSRRRPDREAGTRHIIFVFSQKNGLPMEGSMGRSSHASGVRAIARDAHPRRPAPAACLHLFDRNREFAVPRGYTPARLCYGGASTQGGSEMDQKIINLYDNYTHSRID